MKAPAVVTAVAGALALGGYVAYRTMLVEPEVTAQSEPDSTEELPRAEPAQTLPDFELANLAGEQQSIRSWPDQALIINFWATWCAPCLREIPLLKAFHDSQQSNGITVVGIAVDRPEPVAAFAEDMTFNYPVLVGQAQGMEAAASFGVEFFALPFTVFTDHDANILGVHTGEIHTEDLENLAAVLEALDAGTIDLEHARARIDGRI
ncbi:MAG: redoxin domain-containing protein [Gammaproteobacteria bacterium]|nr:redoxin domain-containing protein [Gammaproteobacteria bacterium]